MWPFKSPLPIVAAAFVCLMPIAGMVMDVMIGAVLVAMIGFLTMDNGKTT